VVSAGTRWLCGGRGDLANSGGRAEDLLKSFLRYVQSVERAVSSFQTNR
jgi:hypothetical protein